MKCPRCGGNGSVPYPIDYEQGLFDETNCDLCGGSGEVQMTNEEWLRQASTEDVAKWLSKISKFFHECGKRDVYPKTMYEEDWEWWLKEKHE